VPTQVHDYIRLLRQFTNNEIDVGEFEQTYLRMFKNQQIELAKTFFQILDSLFADVDSYCSDPELRSEEDLSEEQLREKCVRALERLVA